MISSSPLSSSPSSSSSPWQSSVPVAGLKWDSAVVAICVIANVVFILLGNALTIASFATNRRLRRSKYIPVVSLAVADSLFGLSAVLFLVERQRYAALTAAGPAFPITVMVLANLMANASAWHVTVMAVDRFVAVRFPMFYRRAMTARRLALLTAGCWLIALCVTAPYLHWLSNDVRQVTDPNVSCYQFESDDGPVPLTFDFAIQFGEYAVTSSILVGLSVGVLAAARRRPRRLPHCAGCRLPPTDAVVFCCRLLGQRRQNGDRGSGGDGGGGGQVESSNGGGNSEACRSRQLDDGYYGARRIGSRAYTMVTVIIVVYIISWGPYFIVQTIRLASLSLCHSPAVRIAHIVTAEFGTLNSGVNFIIYALVNRDFRHAYKSLLKRMKLCGRPDKTTQTNSIGDVSSLALRNRLNWPPDA